MAIATFLSIPVRLKSQTYVSARNVGRAGPFRFRHGPCWPGRAPWWYQRNRPTTAPPTVYWSCGGDHYIPIYYFLYIYSPSGCATAASYFHLTFLVHLPFCVYYSSCSKLVFRIFFLLNLLTLSNRRHLPRPSFLP